MRARFEVRNRCISHVTTDCFIVINNKKGLALPANWSALFGVVFGGNTCSRNIPSFSAGPRIIIVCYKQTSLSAFVLITLGMFLVSICLYPISEIYQQNCLTNSHSFSGHQLYLLRHRTKYYQLKKKNNYQDILYISKSSTIHIHYISFDVSRLNYQITQIYNQ